MNDPLPIQWRPRAAPLRASAVAARGASVAPLLQRVLARDETSLSTLRGVGSAAVVVLMGDEAALPWVDGAVFLGRDPRAPSLLVPTASEPSVPMDLLGRALQAQAARQGYTEGVLAVLEGPMVLVPVSEARPLDRALVRVLAESRR